MSWIICGEMWSGVSGIGGEIAFNSILVLLAGMECDLVYVCTQLFSFWRHLQYKPIDKNNIIITVIGLPMVENNLTFMGDQKLGGNDPKFH